MSSILKYVENKDTSEFYPTPERVVIKMIEGVVGNNSYKKSILEPSAGKGDILRCIAKIASGYAEVDCIELDPNLRQILKYNFGERQHELYKERQALVKKYCGLEKRYGDTGYMYYGNGTRVPAPEDVSDRMSIIDEELKCFFKNGINIIHDDFLTYEPLKTYDVIIMNPPFSCGDKHLLKALEIQKNGGEVVCLLNAQTIRNPYTETRKELLRCLEKYNASIEYITSTFIDSERPTEVEVALIKVKIEQKQEESEIWEQLKKAEKIEEETFNDSSELEVTDYIKAAVVRFRLEAKAGIELFRQYKALIPYISTSFDSEKFFPILRITIGSNNETATINLFLKALRSKYWQALLFNKKFSGKLTSTLQQEYHRQIDRLSDYDFTEYNIYSLSAEMNAKIRGGIEEEIVKMFDRLTEEHCWYPEMTKNKHYFDGWRTNKAHYISKKVIIPCRGVFDDYTCGLRVYGARKCLEDIERILNFLDGNMSADVDSWSILEEKLKLGETKNIALKFFSATFYKKGTVHLTFTNPKLIERFNIYAAQNKKWLPPCYGKTQYKDMNTEEQAVINSFQGEEEYSKVMRESDYYLAPPTNKQVLQIGTN